jgi:uncharacterized membrane protein (UPF0127 family)
VFPVDLRSPGWVGARVGVAETFLDRLMGIRSAAGREGVLLRVRSVHTFGLSKPISVFSTSRDGTVVEVRTLRPNRVAVFRGAEHLIELPDGRDLPLVGSQVTSSNE